MYVIEMKEFKYTIDGKNTRFKLTLLRVTSQA